MTQEGKKGRLATQVTVIKMKIIRFMPGDVLVMKKNHPCGSDRFDVLRVGSDIRVRCQGCGRDVTVPRVKLEHNIKEVEAAQTDNAAGKDE